jgi:hypothetical protein
VKVLRLAPATATRRARRRGASGGGRRRVPTERIPPPRGRRARAPPLGAAGRGSHQDTGAQASTFCEYPAEPCAAPAGPLRSYLSPTCVTAAWCGPITIANAGERSGWEHPAIHDLEAHHACMHLLVAGKAHHRSGTFHSRHIGVGK